MSAMTVTAISVAATLGTYATAASAQDPAPDLTAKLLECRSVAAESSRLACYDSATAAFAAARAGGELVVLDRQEVEQARRRTFGLDIDILNPFDRQERPTALQSITSTVTSARQVAGGKWLVSLADGSTWLQIDTETVHIRRTSNLEARIRRAAMGSYLMSVDGARSMRVKRQ
ncbi:hypothetical protein D3C86_871700 [compost metagenome]